jgi:hypothetical protein
VAELSSEGKKKSDANGNAPNNKKHVDDMFLTLKSYEDVQERQDK